MVRDLGALQDFLWLSVQHQKDGLAQAKKCRTSGFPLGFFVAESCKLRRIEFSTLTDPLTLDADLT